MENKSATTLLITNEKSVIIKIYFVMYHVNLQNIMFLNKNYTKRIKPT